MHDKASQRGVTITQMRYDIFGFSNATSDEEVTEG
jgi:hypothetical protein